MAALMRLLSRVHPFVFLQIGKIAELFSTERAVEWSRSIVQVDVSLKRELVVELLSTRRAGVAGRGVHFHVLLKVCLHLELLITDTAHKHLGLIIGLVRPRVFQK